ASSPQPPAAPGMIPGAMPPPSYSPDYSVPFDRSGVPLEKPEGLAKALIIVAAAFTLVALVSAVFAQGDVDAIRQAAETGEFVPSAGSLVTLLGTPLLIASFVIYGLWMTRMRRNREAMGIKPGLGGVEWWGWFVPAAGLVLVPMGARRVSGRSVSLGLLLGWWLTFVLTRIVAQGASALAQFSVDLTTGELVRPELLDAYPSLIWASFALTLISFAFFVQFIRAATQHHLEP
ncbi:MAG: hypothetical protein ACLGHM_11245, partial [Actinomycetes bacterium]